MATWAAGSKSANPTWAAGSKAAAPTWSAGSKAAAPTWAAGGKASAPTWASQQRQDAYRTWASETYTYLGYPLTWQDTVTITWTAQAKS